MKFSKFGIKSFFHREESERGQAMAEYHVLIPGTIVLAGFLFAFSQGTLSGMFCDIVNSLGQEICTAEGGGGGGEQLNAEPTPTMPAPTEVACTELNTEQGSSQCSQADGSCKALDAVGTNLNSATHQNANGDIQAFVIKAGQQYRVYHQGSTNDGCYDVQISGSVASWTKIGNGKNCKDVSHIQNWNAPLCE
jgi:hypothetical protein